MSNGEITEINIIYNTDRFENKIQIFGSEFVKNNRNISKMIIDNKVYEIADTILDICREPVTFDSLLQKLFTQYRLTMTFEQHALVGSTVRSYLTWLKEHGRLQAEIDNNRLLWKAIDL